MTPLATALCLVMLFLAAAMPPPLELSEIAFRFKSEPSIPSSYFAAAKQSAKHSFATRELRRLDNQNSLRPIHEFDLRAGHQTVLFAHGRRNRDLSFACDSLRKVSLTPAHQVNISPYGLLLFPVHSAFHIQMSLPGSSRLENSSTLKAFVFVILHSALRRRRHHLRGHSNSARALSNCTSPAVPAI